MVSFGRNRWRSSEQRKGYPGCARSEHGAAVLVPGGSCNPRTVAGSHAPDGIGRHPPVPEEADSGRCGRSNSMWTLPGPPRRPDEGIGTILRRPRRWARERVRAPCDGGLALMETGSDPKLICWPHSIGCCHEILATSMPTARPGHGADHLLPALISPSTTIPVLGGRIALGTWQSLVLVDLTSTTPGDMCDSASSRHSRTLQNPEISARPPTRPYGPSGSPRHSAYRRRTPGRGSQH